MTHGNSRTRSCLFMPQPTVVNTQTQRRRTRVPGSRNDRVRRSMTSAQARCFPASRPEPPARVLNLSLTSPSDRFVTADAASDFFDTGVTRARSSSSDSARLIARKLPKIEPDEPRRTAEETLSLPCYRLMSRTTIATFSPRFSRTPSRRRGTSAPTARRAACPSAVRRRSARSCRDSGTRYVDDNRITAVASHASDSATLQSTVRPGWLFASNITAATADGPATARNRHRHDERLAVRDRRRRCRLPSAETSCARRSGTARCRPRC